MYGDVLATMARHSALDIHNDMRPFTTLGATLLTGVSAFLFAAPLSAHPGMGVSSEGMPAGHPAVTKANRQLFDLIAGGIALHRNEHEFAANAFYDAFQQTPTKELAEMAWQAAVSARDSDLVVRIAEEWLKIDPKSEIAQQSLLARDIEKETVGAVRDRLAVMYRNAEDKVAWTARMTELLAKSKLSYAVAKNLLEPYQSRHRNAPQVQLASAVHAKMNSRYEEACRLAASAQKGLPDDEETVSLAADICWPVARKETQSMLERFLKRHPDADTVLLIYGRVLARAGQKEAALKEADRATKGDVENPNLLYTAGLLANEARAPEEALAYFRRYVKYLREESPGIDLSHTDVWLQIGQTALALERPAEAAEAFAELKSGPFARQARLNEARAWAAAGEIDKAIESLRTARQDPHGNEEPLIRAEAELLLEADRKDDAMRVIDEAYERYGKSTDFLYDAAMIAQESGDSKKSETYLLELLDINPDHVQASNALGYLWADQNRRLPEARALLEGAYRLAPLDPYVLDSMGWLCYREGKFDEAAEFILLSLKRQFDVEVAEHLIEVLVAAKRNDEAASLWQDLRKRTNDAPEVLAFGERMGLKR